MQFTLAFRLLAVVLFSAGALKLSAQGSAISYQGRLDVSGSPANTNYDFVFRVFDAPTNGAAISVPLTNSAVPVANGLFNVTLNFGSGVFNGTDNGSNDWLDIAVRAVGVTNFTELTPRQPILPAPYALFATSASNLLGSLQSTQIVGAISSALISGTYSNAVSFVSGANSFAGNGANLTNLNATQISSGTLADARLETDVALLDQNQTFTSQNVFTASNSFTGPNTFTGVNFISNNANYFVGSFFGNGLVGWLPVYGANTNAMRDAGYLLLNAGLSAMTLPATSSLFVGDIVRVSGGGGGGWLVKENSGQSIIGNFASYGNCYLAQMTNNPTKDGSGVTASADGVRMYVAGSELPYIYASSDSGRTWSQVGPPSGTTPWTSVACSANGMIVYAQPASGAIQQSTDSGATWSATGSSATGYAIACTSGGTLISGANNYACSGSGVYRARLFNGIVNISTNSGAVWYAVNTPASMTCLAVSSDCTRMVAGVTNGFLYATSNEGATWTTLTSTHQAWSAAWMSPDGSKFAATVAEGSIFGGVYSCVVSPLPNASTTTSSGSVCGSLGSSVELQYLGNGVFMPVGSTGLLWAN